MSMVRRTGYLLFLYSIVCTFESLSLLYLLLYVLGDDSWISQGLFLKTKNLCILVQVRIKVDVDVGTVKQVYATR